MAVMTVTKSSERCPTRFLEPRFIVVGPLAYERLREGVASRFGRENQHVEQVQWLTVVVDPARGDRVCVLPPPREAHDGVRIETI